MKVLRGSEITPYIETIAKFRLDIFVDFPYLYQGELKQEINYVTEYALSTQGILIFLEDEKGVKAASLGMPLNEKSASFTKPYNYENIQHMFYIGELMVRQDARQRGLGRELMHKMISEIDRSLFTHYCLYTVQRHDSHPLRPDNYTSPDHLWKMFGFEKELNKQAQLSWLETGATLPSEKMMTIWVKQC